MRAERGTYALLLHSTQRDEIQIGRQGRLCIEPGYYVYVGSAFGPGGIRGRVARHLRHAKRMHWHIDYLRAASDVVCVWCSYSPTRLEHDWARAFAQAAGAACIDGFGCTDCDCPSHLFRLPVAPDSTQVESLLGVSVECHAVAYRERHT